MVLGDHYSVGLLHARNDAMIRDCDLAVAVWKPSHATGGTASAVAKLRRLGRPLLLVDVDRRTITREGF